MNDLDHIKAATGCASDAIKNMVNAREKPLETQRNLLLAVIAQVLTGLLLVELHREKVKE